MIVPVKPGSGVTVMVPSPLRRTEAEAGGAGVELADEANGKYLSLQFKDDVLIGATSIGRTEHVGVLRGLIQNRTRLGRWKDELIADPTQFAKAYVARSQLTGLTRDQ